MKTYHPVRPEESSKIAISLWSLGKFCHIFFQFPSKPGPSRVHKSDIAYYKVLLIMCLHNCIFLGYRIP